LLKKEQPELCYQCHEFLESDPIPEHPDDAKLQCTECHDPHGGSERYFLKKQNEET
jgi:predicted CXXCH cytochrome family protein